MSKLLGRATPEATRIFASRNTHIPHGIIPKLNLSCSRFGFGAFRLTDSHNHQLALSTALSKGINVIDTAFQFLNERVIGTVLEKLVNSEKLRREEIVLITKAGFASNETKDSQYRNLKDFVELSNGIQSFHPTFLEESISNSLKELNAETIDIFMLDGPERLLSAKNKTYSIGKVLDEMRVAFEHLEKEVERGMWIKSAKVCHLMILNPSQDTHHPGHLNLRDILKSSEESENFVAIEYPFNIYENNAIDSENDILEIAKSLNLYQFTNRGLNVIDNGMIKKLISGYNQDAETELMQRLSLQFESVLKLEADVTTNSVIGPDAIGISAQLIWGQVLADSFNTLTENLFALQHYINKTVKPSIDQCSNSISLLAERETSEDFKEYLMNSSKTYQKEIMELCEILESLAKLKLQRTNDDLHKLIALSYPKPYRGKVPQTLQETAIALVGSAIGSRGTMLVGMRDVSYVNNVIQQADKLIPENVATDILRIDFAN
ncbi:hypothetical protein HK098_001305 [Nowakowskiella sp. JEL0407]|nr:hypothetical protein HK098_001305 [Nowakowskiella sp. JEL0407]